VGRNKGTHRGGSSEGTKRKRAAAEAAAVRFPIIQLQNTNGSGGGDRHIKI
jgi:hypothetical protein